MSNQYPETDIIEKFCVLASELHNDWVFHVTMFARNKDVSVLENPSLVYLFEHLLNVTHENLMLKWAKLHDPAQQTRGYNLSLAYIVEKISWEDCPETAAKLSDLKQQLDSLLKKSLTPARNKLICHNDLETILSGNSLGGFQCGLDDDYFSILQEFVNLAHKTKIGGPYPFDTLVQGDIELFLDRLKKDYSLI